MKAATAIHSGQATYQNNLDVLRGRFPDAYRQIVDLADNPTILVQDFVNNAGQVNARFAMPDGRLILFYDSEDIVEEIDRQLGEWQLEDRDFLCCIGMGLGYLPLIASQCHASQPSIVIVEPNPAILKLALERVDLQPLLHYPKLHLVLGADDAVRDQILHLKDRLFFGKIKLVSHGASSRFFGESFEQLEQAVVDNIQVIRNICYTAREAGSQILTNTMANLPSLFGGPDLGRLKDLLSGFPAVCVAAGPSLDKDIELLRTIKDRAALLCCDSAVHALVSAGITPHMVVTTDRLPVNFEKIRLDLQHLRNSVLVFGAEANPDNVRAFLSPRRFAVSADSVLLNRWVGPQLGLDWQLPAMTSVSHTAIFTAMKLGADPIVLVGMDFALSDGQSHAQGSVFRYPSESATMIPVEGVDGRQVNALSQLIADRRQIENVIAEHRLRLIDVSLSGARIRGAEIRSLQEVVDTMLNPQGGVAQRLDNVVWEPCSRSADVVLVMEKILAAIKKFHEACCQSQRVCLRCVTGREPGLTEVHNIRKGLAQFEQRHDLLMRILHMLRYADTQMLTARMDDLANVRRQLGDANHGIGEEVAIYADHYESLEKAGRLFETLLTDRIAYFKKEATIGSRLSGAVLQAGRLLELGEHYLQSGELWQAEPVYRRHLKDASDDNTAWRTLGQYYIDRQLWHLARELLNEWNKGCTDNAVIASFEEQLQSRMASILKEAAASLENGHTEIARRRLEEYLRWFPEDIMALELRQQLHQLTDCDAKSAANGQAMPIPDEEREALLIKVQRLLNGSQPEPAIGILEGLLQAIPEQAARFREQIGDIRFEQHDYASAGWHYQKTLEIAPGHSALEKKLLHARRCKTATIGDLKAPETGTSRYDNSPKPEDLCRQAQELIGIGDTPRAISALKQLLAVRPDDAQAHNDLGVLHLNDGDKAAAYWHYCQAVQLEPGNRTFQKNLADFTYAVLGDVKAAMEIYVKLLADNPSDAELLTTLGQVCINQGQFGDARYFFQQVLAIDPGNQGIQQLMQQVNCHKDN